MQKLKQAQLAPIFDFWSGHRRDPLRPVVGIECVILLFLTVSKVGWCVKFVSVHSGRLWRLQIVLFFLHFSICGDKATTEQEWVMVVGLDAYTESLQFVQQSFCCHYVAIKTSLYIRTHTHTNHQYIFVQILFINLSSIDVRNCVFHVLAFILQITYN